MVFICGVILDHIKFMNILKGRIVAECIDKSH